jgi:hypothetical protein
VLRVWCLGIGYSTHLTCPHLQVRLCEAEGATCTALVADVGSAEACKKAVSMCV